ncbi:hypothetical protein HYC85_001237 [Camellia sinensis]|uniref:Fumarate lyase N-terminal domain-containing protein n=1 Tax=Camellia sinensis TaxID=4442 RepID=A0A7J7I7B1_CAMSI|nr:hypothetical protein HYC85_001237 [Camellia sinensis]
MGHRTIMTKYKKDSPLVSLGYDSRSSVMSKQLVSHNFSGNSNCKAQVHNHVLEDGDERHSNDMENWLLHPMRESNLQLFALVSIWISRKVDILQEVVLMQVLDFEIGTSNIAFKFLEELFIQFKGIATVGKLVNFEACKDIMDLLYEKDQTSALYNSPKYLAALILACAFTFLISNLLIQKCCTCYVASYVITVPKQRWEFPVLPWASPTTLGKEIAILAVRLSRERRNISQVEIMGKFAGAVRNYNAHLVAYPDIKWPQIAEEFVKSLGLSFNPYVTQGHVGLCIFRLLQAGELSDMFVNMLRYWFSSPRAYVFSSSNVKQITKAGEIGSSTMPHKAPKVQNSSLKTVSESLNTS